MKIPILLITHDRPYLLPIVLDRIIKHTDWEKFHLWVLDNNSSSSTKKIIQAYKEKYSLINIYESAVNQIALIQNKIITKLKSDIYIKLDDDILVSKNWTDGFVGVLNRFGDTMSFGSVIIPINGFGWLPFIEIMGFKDEFISKFPLEKLAQDCMNVPVWNNEKVVEYIWNKTLDIDASTKQFIEKQDSKFQDLLCHHRYSIGAIIFTHDIWVKMGGWKVSDSIYRRINTKKNIEKVIKKIAAVLKKENLNRTNEIFDLLLNLKKSALGVEEQAIYDFSIENGLKIPVTTQSIVFHFSFGPTDEYISKKIFLNIK